jgi:hypothetical protein
MGELLIARTPSKPRIVGPAITDLFPCLPQISCQSQLNLLIGSGALLAWHNLAAKTPFVYEYLLADISIQKT